jgi:hypothetical protein
MSQTSLVLGPEWAHQSLAGGYRLLGRDPIGILLPCGAALLAQVLAMMAVRGAVSELDPTGVLTLALAALAVRLVIGGILRAPTLAAGARALDRPASAALAIPGVVFIDLLVAALELLAAAIPLVPAVALALFALSRGIPLLAAILAGGGAVLAALAILVVRALFAYAPAEVVVARKSAPAALAASFSRARYDLPALVLLLLAGDVAVGLGGAFCGVGALPGYPLSDLAVLHRWAGVEVR